MNKYLIPALASIGLVLSACDNSDRTNDSVLAEEVETNGYTEYENDRYDFVIGYPADRFSLRDAPRNNDGRVLDGPENSTLRVFGTNNALGLTFDEQIARASDSLSEILTETRDENSWYVEARDHEGQWVSLKMIHDGPDRLITARFTADDGAGTELRETGRIAVRSLQLDDNG